MTLQEQQQREMMANEVRRFELFGNTPGYQGITPEQYAQFTQALGVQGAGAGNQTSSVISAGYVGPGEQKIQPAPWTQPGGPGGLNSVQPAQTTVGLSSVSSSMPVGLGSVPSGGGVDALRSQILSQWGNAGQWNNDSVDLAGDLARRMYASGITDLSKLQFTPTKRREQVSAEYQGTDEYRPAQFADYDNAFDLTYDGKAVGSKGFIGNINRDGSLGDGNVFASNTYHPNLLAWNSGGKGAHNYEVSFDEKGNPVVKPVFQSSSFWNSDLGGLTKAAAMSVGAYFGAGALNGAGTGGLSGLDAAMLDAGAGATNVGAGAAGAGAGAGSASIGGLNGIEFGAGLDGGATLTGGSVLTSGGTPAFGTTLADATIGVGGGGALGSSLAGQTYGGFMPNVGGGASSLFQIGGTPTMPSTPSSPPGNSQTPPASPTNTGNNKPGGNTPNLGNLSGWQQLAALAGGLGGAALGANALANPVDTSRFDRLFDGLLAEQAKVSARGDDQWANYLATFRPIEQKLASTALNYDTPERRAMAAREAQGDVATQFDIQRQGFNEDATRYGLDPTSITALNNASRIEEAKAKAGAGNQARMQVEERGLGLIDSAARFGRNLPGTSLQASGVATGTANSAAGVANTQANLTRQNTQDRNALFGDLLGAGLQAWGMFGSSKKTKKVGGKVDGLAAVEAVEKSPASRWAYKPGEGDGNTKPRMGPMAEDLAKVAPHVSDGKQVDAVSMLGLHHAAIAELARKVRMLTEGQDGVYEEAMEA